MTTTLLIIDPQNDFCDAQKGSLYVPGADEDTARLAAFIHRFGDTLDTIIISLDSHQRVDISHPLWWTNAQGEHPTPFTVISSADIESGTWSTTQQSQATHSTQYVQQLEAGERYPHVIWPEHCLVGHWGHNLLPVLHNELGEWEAKQHKRVHYVYKGTNPGTEHFSAIRAEVPIANDPATHPQKDLLDRLSKSTTILVAGQARSHCVANTVRDLVELRPETANRIVLLTDTTSDVPSFEALGEAFVSDVTALGMRTSTTAQWT